MAKRKEMKLMNMLFVAAMCAATLIASPADVPPAADVRAAGKIVEEITKNDRRNLNQKTITKEQYADAIMSYAESENRPAVRFALLKEAFRTYLDSRSYDGADGAYSRAQAEGGIEYAIAVTAYARIPNAAEKLKTRIKTDKEKFERIASLRKQLARSPKNEAINEKIGLEYVAIDEWERAMQAFLKAPGEIAKITAWELKKDGAYTAAKAAKFWWHYAKDKPKAMLESLRIHAATWYEIAIAEDAYSNVEAEYAQSRIAETKAYDTAIARRKAVVAKQVREVAPMSVPVNANHNIEFIGVPSGEFTMGVDGPMYKKWCHSVIKPHKVKITRQFWLSKTKVTKELWSVFEKDKPKLSDYEKAVGGVRVPQVTSYNDACDFCEWLTKRVSNVIKLPPGYVIRLPTEAEWEYALFLRDADEKSIYHNWEDNRRLIAWKPQEVRKLCDDNGFDSTSIKEGDLRPIEVGLKKPNGLGLYDMLGNGAEIMLDTFDGTSFENLKILHEGKNGGQVGIAYKDNDSDPLGYFERLYARYITRGCCHTAWGISPYGKMSFAVNGKSCYTTFRLCIGPDLIKEKGYTFRYKKR